MLRKKKKDIEEIKKEAAVAFVNWQLVADCEYSATDEDQWTHTDTGENVTTSNLYDIYLQQVEKENTNT